MTTEERLRQIRGHVARGWCYPKNENKAFDSDLAEAITFEVCLLIFEIVSEMMSAMAEERAPQQPEKDKGELGDLLK